MRTLAEIKSRTVARKAAGIAIGMPGAPQVAAAPPAKPCQHLGRDLTGPERERHGKDHARRWSLCLHPEIPLGQFVCPCKGCDSGCRGYQSSD